MLLAVALLPSLVAAACPEPVAAAALADAVAGAELAFVRLDGADFRVRVDAAEAALACLAEPLTPEVAARVHRLFGLSAFVERDAVGARRAFASARRADPTLPSPGAGLPDGHPVRALWAEADAASCPGEDGRADRWDGRVDTPACRPGVAQWGDPVRVTAWVDVGDPLPAPRPAPASAAPSSEPVVAVIQPIPASPPPSPEGASPPSRRGLTLTLGAGAGVGLLAAGGLGLGAALVADDFRTQRHDADELVSLAARANGLGTAALASAGIAVASGALAVVSVRW